MIARFAFVLALTLLSGTAFAQQSSGAPSGGVGIGSGAAAVDPSKNVLDTVLAAITRLNDLMAAAAKRADDLREADLRFQSSQRDAETRRVNELAAQKQVFDLELARSIRASADSSAQLLAVQVKDLKSDTSDRISKLEVYANETRGRSSAMDPATTQLYADVRTLLTRQADTAGVGTGRTDMAGWIAGAVASVLMLLLLTVGLIYSVLERRSRTVGDQHEREDAERYRRHVERRIAEPPSPPVGAGAR